MNAYSRMVPGWTALMVLLGPLVAAAQTGGTGSPNGAPGYGSIGGSYLNGLGEAIRAQGQHNLLNSEAIINAEEARRKYIENRGLATRQYFDLRKLNREYRQAEAPPPASASQAAALAKAAAPKILSVSQLDPVSGRIAWPLVLRANRYAEERGRIEEMVQALTDHQSQPDYSAAVLLRDAAYSMLEKLRSQIEVLPPNDFLAGKKFLDSLVYTITSGPL